MEEVKISNDKCIYLDTNAGIPIKKEVATMWLKATQLFNSSNTANKYGLTTAKICNNAMESIKSYFSNTSNTSDNCKIISTSGATESLDAIIHSMSINYPSGVFLVHESNHPSIFTYLEENNLEYITLRNTEETGSIPFISGFYSNKEIEYERISTFIAPLTESLTGRIVPFKKIAQHLKKNDPSIKCICDITQSVGKMSLTLKSINADAILFSAHKIGGPLGVGFLIMDDSIKYYPLISGPQQNGLRGGTVNHPGIIASATALQLNIEKCEENHEKNLKTIEILYRDLDKHNYKILNVGSIQDLLKNTIGNTLLVRVEEVCAYNVCYAMSKRGYVIGTGYACKTDKNGSQIRISINEEITSEDIKDFAKALDESVIEARSM